MKPGTLFHDRYRIDETIGRGGCATVYRCWDRTEQAPRALKVLLPGRPDRLVRRLRNEAKAMARFTHPNILKVHDVNIETNSAYIVMELASTSLADRMMTQGMVPSEAVGWMLQVLSALSETHAIGIVHRDIKPPNILIHEDGHAVLADFGIALDHDNSRHTNVGSTLGSIAFMAPEQRLDASSVEHHADLYACGATLYHLITGHNPIDLFLDREDSRRLKDVPSMLRATILKATRHDTRKRFASAAEMADALRACMAEARDMPQVLDPASKDRAREAAKALTQPRFATPQSITVEVPELAPPPAPNSPAAPTLPVAESARQHTLDSLDILDTPAEERFDRHVRLAQQALGVPIALVSLVDSHRQWFKSRRGLDVHETSRHVSFCAHAIHHPEQLFEVRDTHTDPRFRDNPLVQGAPHIRFYAGHPVLSPSGLPMGTLCVIDKEPRQLDDKQRLLLADLAGLVQKELLFQLRETVDVDTGLSNEAGFLLHAQCALAAASPTERWSLLRVRVIGDMDVDGIRDLAQELSGLPTEPAVIARHEDSFLLLTRTMTRLQDDVHGLQSKLPTNVQLMLSTAHFQGRGLDTIGSMLARTQARFTPQTPVAIEARGRSGR